MKNIRAKRFVLKKFWSFSLRIQTILLILFTIISVQTVTLYIASEFRESYAQNVVVNHLSSTIRVLRASLNNTPKKERKEFVTKASLGQWDYIERPLPQNSYHSWARGQRRLEAGKIEPDRHKHHNNHGTLGKMVRQLNQEFNDGTRIGLSRGPDSALYISLVPTVEPGLTAQTRDWLVVPLNRIETPDTTHLYIIWLAVSLTLLLLSLYFSWYITRPLGRLSQAVEQVAKGLTVYVKPSGPRETQKLGAQFNHMQQCLNESNKVQQTLLAGLPHDLKSPLARVWLRLEMAEDETLKQGMRKDLQEMQAIINQFIAYVHGSDPSNYQLDNLNITQWLNERVCSWQEAGKDIQLLQLPDDQSRTIKADKLALDRLLDNLIANALKHGAAPVEIRAVTKDSDSEIHLSVSDHGNGIPPQLREEALRAFSRLDKARTKTGSVGLGLALVEQIVLSHGGRLELNENSNGGLCIDIYFPLS